MPINMISTAVSTLVIFKSLEPPTTLHGKTSRDGEAAVLEGQQSDQCLIHLIPKWQETPIVFMQK